MKQKKLEDITLTELLAVCSNYVEELEREDVCDEFLEDIKSDIFEAAMEAVYGEKIWDFIRSKGF